MPHSRRLGNGQRVGDLAVGTALREEGNNLVLTLREGTCTRTKRDTRRARLVAGQWTGRGTRARTHNSEGTDWFAEALERQHSERRGIHQVLRRRMHPLADEDLTIACLITQ